jgi:hypothetical protein
MKVNGWLSVLIAVPLALAGCGGGEGDLEDDGPGEETASTTSPGSALVTFGICGGQRLTVSSTSAAFIQEAQQQLQGGKVRIPIFDLLDGRGVDPQWTWHVSPATTIFADSAIEVCDGCPAAVEKDKAYWIHRVKRYCPWSAKVVRVVK